MEYAVRLLNPGPLPKDPRRLCPVTWRKLLPDGPLTALYFGSEFCQDLIPDIKEAEEFCALAKDTGLEAVLLTPVVRSDGLSLLQELVTELKNRGWSLTVVFNDLGVLRMLNNDHPQGKRQAGRLINRALRDPRLAEQPQESQIGETARGGQIRALLQRFGVAGLETDPDLEGSYLGNGEAELLRVLHLPYIFATSGRNCLFKAEAQQEHQNFAKNLSRTCRVPCRQRGYSVDRSDLDHPLWRAGNTLFYEATQALVEAHLGRADRIVIHESPMS